MTIVLAILAAIAAVGAILVISMKLTDRRGSTRSKRVLGTDAGLSHMHPAEWDGAVGDGDGGGSD